MEISEKEVLTQLKLRKVRLTLELQRVDVAIKAFEGVNLNELNELEIMAIHPDLHNDLHCDTSTDARLIVYDKKFTNHEKVLWALGKLMSATSTEITDYILRFDDSINNRTRLLNGIRYEASRMYNAHKINGKKLGQINMYSLKG